MVLVSVVIPARNAASTLGACLAGLRAEGIPGWNAELLIVNDASTDGTRTVASEPGVQVLEGEGRGPAAARNLGIRYAKGEVVVFLDADTVPQPGWFQTLLGPFDDPAVVGVKGRYRSEQRGLVARFAQLEFEAKYKRLERQSRTEGSVDFIDTGNAAYRRDALVTVGGFDESFPAQSAEDVDLAFRLAARGAKFVFAPQASVLHWHAESLAALLTKKARYGYFRVRVYRRFPQKALGDSYTPPLMAIQIGLAGLSGLLTLAFLARIPRAGALLRTTVVAFAATTLGEARSALSQPELAVVLPPLVFLRAFAQGLGIFAGLIAQLVERRRAAPRSADDVHS